MAEILMIGSIAEKDNSVVVSYSSDTARWCVTDLPQTSAVPPALAILNENLWVAFSGKTSKTIYTASLSDWGNNISIGQSSNLGPAMAAFNNGLWIAYVSETTGHIEVISSSNGIDWLATGKVDTGISSKLSPALIVYNGALWLAYVGEAAGHIELVSSADGKNWGGHTDTGESSKCTPALAALASEYEPQLWVAFIGEASGHVELIPSSLSLDPTPNGIGWGPKLDSGLASKFAPGLTVFTGKLWAAFVGEATGRVELISTDGITCSSSSDTGVPTQIAPVLCGMTVPEPPAPLGGSHQYILSGPPPVNDVYVPLQGLVVEIKITEPIFVSPMSGVTNASPLPLPCGFQINCFSPNLAKFESAPGSQLVPNQTVGWQQYGVRMRSGNNQFIAFAENWPQGYPTNPELPNLFQTIGNNRLSLPNNLTIPAGWTIRIEFQHQSDGTVQGIHCSVTDDANGAPVGPNMDIDLLSGNVLKPGGGAVTQADLAPIVAFQVVLVGSWAGAQATLTSGAGQITCTATTEMTPMNAWPPDSDGHSGTAEWANSVYSLLPPQSSHSIAQAFGVTKPLIASIGGVLSFVVAGSGFIPYDKLTASYTLFGGGSGVSESGTADCVSAQDGTFSCAINPANYPGPAFAPGTVTFSVTVTGKKGMNAQAECHVDTSGVITGFQRGQSYPG